MVECERDGCSNPRKSVRAKWCADPKCERVRVRDRVRKTRSGEKPVREPEVEQPRAAGGVFSATLVALTEAGRVASPAGQNALALATRIDGGATDTGSSIAALSKQHLAAMAEALRDVQAAKVDSVDELRRRREARGA